MNSHDSPAHTFPEGDRTRHCLVEEAETPQERHWQVTRTAVSFPRPGATREQEKNSPVTRNVSLRVRGGEEDRAVNKLLRKEDSK